MKYACVFISALITLFWFGCKRASTDSIPNGAYAYGSYDSIGSPQKIGPQTGDGKLVGGINGEKVWIELNPEVRNNNLQLNGTLAMGRLSGQWTWITYNGMANQGSFKAVRK